MKLTCPVCKHTQEVDGVDGAYGTYIINCNNDDDKHCMGSIEATPKGDGKGWGFKKIQVDGKKEDYDNGIHSHNISN